MENLYFQGPGPAPIHNTLLGYTKIHFLLIQDTLFVNPKNTFC